MGEIDDVQDQLEGLFFDLRSNRNYLRLMDTPRVWGMPFGREIMHQAWTRQGEFQRALDEVVQKTRYRCDIASLNAPDPDWTGIILGAMDTALTTQMNRTTPTQFRFLFGQTPMGLLQDPDSYKLFKQAVIRVVRERRDKWEKPPEIWLGRYYRVVAGISAAAIWKLFGSAAVDAPDKRMTWNHSKIIVADATEALVGGHNLNMDLFLSYPPVHDLSVVVHGPAAADAHTYLDQMWIRGSDLLTIEQLDVQKLQWEKRTPPKRPSDPLTKPDAGAYVRDSQEQLARLHDQGAAPSKPADSPSPVPRSIRDQDLQTLQDLGKDVFPVRQKFSEYAALSEYKLATKYLMVGKYWLNDEIYKDDSDKMKKSLILGAKRTIKMSQMDLVSAWKKNWSDHVVCHWILEALLANKGLTVQVVVSPLDAGAGAEGDQYSFGSGAVRTFGLMRYYMLHDAKTDGGLPDPDGQRAEALSRLFIAPLYYTDAVPPGNTVEGETYKWPDLYDEGYTATLKQPPLSEKPPRGGEIGSAYEAVKKASGLKGKVPSAPGNHSKLMVIDDEKYVVGSDNLYPGYLSEFNYVIEGKEAVTDLLENYWKPLWKYAGPHALTGGKSGSCCAGPGRVTETRSDRGYGEAKCWCKDGVR